MALEPSLWGTLPKELLHLVFSSLPVAGIGQLRVLSKEWKRNIDCKDSDFNRVFDATTHCKMLALMSWVEMDEVFGNLYDMQANEWHAFEPNSDYVPVYKTSAADGGLSCDLWLRRELEWHWQIQVVNPLTQRKMILPPLLSTEAGEYGVWIEMVQFTMDRKTKGYKLHVVGHMKIGGNDRFAQVYDSHVNGWSLMEAREGRIIGWEYSRYSLAHIYPCMYNCVDGNLHSCYPPDIAPGLTMDSNCIELMNDHLFVLHKEAHPSSTNLVQDSESNSRKYCIFEFHLPKKATTWVKLGVHKCDSSIYGSLEEDCELSLLACNGFLLVCSKVLEQFEYEEDHDRFWLYNLSTCAWCNLTGLEIPTCCNLVLCELSWSALP